MQVIRIKYANHFTGEVNNVFVNSANNPILVSE